MEQFDELLRSMAKKEEIIVPKGFDERMQDVLDNLPARAKKAGLGAVKTALIAAVACAVLLGTAFAASPTPPVTSSKKDSSAALSKGVNSLVRAKRMHSRP